MCVLNFDTDHRDDLQESSEHPRRVSRILVLQVARNSLAAFNCGLDNARVSLFPT